jgi:serine/threonine protein kinase
VRELPLQEWSPAPYERRFGRFEKRLGEGAAKVVYEAIDLNHGHLVAWNEVTTRHLNPEQRDRVAGEVQLLQAVHHERIIDYYGSWATPDRVVIITAIVESGDLQRFYKAHRVKLKVIKKWCRQIIAGIMYLHSHSPPIIHRDIKCENVLYNAADGTLRISDLGLSTQLVGETDAAAVLGTPNFMAPEMYEGTYDARVDVYSFGMTVLEMVTRSLPYDECSNAGQMYFKKVVQNKLPDAFYHIKYPSIQDFVLFCVATEPGGQRPTAAEVAAHPFLDEANAMPEDEDDELTWPDAQPAGTGAGQFTGAAAVQASASAGRVSIDGDAANDRNVTGHAEVNGPGRSSGGDGGSRSDSGAHQLSPSSVDSNASVFTGAEEEFDLERPGGDIGSGGGSSGDGQGDGYGFGHMLPSSVGYPAAPHGMDFVYRAVAGASNDSAAGDRSVGLDMAGWESVPGTAGSDGVDDVLGGDGEQDGREGDARSGRSSPSVARLGGSMGAAEPPDMELGGFGAGGQADAAHFSFDGVHRRSHARSAGASTTSVDSVVAATMEAERQRREATAGMPSASGRLYGEGHDDNFRSMDVRDAAAITPQMSGGALWAEEHRVGAATPSESGAGMRNGPGATDGGGYADGGADGGVLPAPASDGESGTGGYVSSEPPPRRQVHDAEAGLAALASPEPLDPSRNLLTATTPYYRSAPAAVEAVSEASTPAGPAFHLGQPPQSQHPRPSASTSVADGASQRREYVPSQPMPAHWPAVAAVAAAAAAGAGSDRAGGLAPSVRADGRAMGASGPVLLTLEIEHDPQENGSVTRASMTVEFDRDTVDITQTARDIVTSLLQLPALKIDASCVPMFTAFLATQCFEPAVELVTSAVTRFNWRCVRLRSLAADGAGAGSARSALRSPSLAGAAAASPAFYGGGRTSAAVATPLRVGSSGGHGGVGGMPDLSLDEPFPPERAPDAASDDGSSLLGTPRLGRSEGEATMAAAVGTGLRGSTTTSPGMGVVMGERPTAGGSRASWTSPDLDFGAERAYAYRRGSDNAGAGREPPAASGNLSDVEDARLPLAAGGDGASEMQDEGPYAYSHGGSGGGEDLTSSPPQPAAYERGQAGVVHMREPALGNGLGESYSGGAYPSPSVFSGHFSGERPREAGTGYGTDGDERGSVSYVEELASAPVGSPSSAFYAAAGSGARSGGGTGNSDSHADASSFYGTASSTSAASRAPWPLAHAGLEGSIGRPEAGRDASPASASPGSGSESDPG